MKLIISEKPSLAFAYAKALGVKGKKDGYMENNEFIITWCVGHLITLSDPSVYDEKYKTYGGLIMRIKIIADSTCDLSKELIEKYDITILPLTVIKDGDSVRFYDHQTGNLTREMTVKEANEALRSERKKALPDDTEASPEAKAKTETKIREIEAWARENVKGYSELTPNERREIRAMIRQARALGIPDIDIGRYANLSARTRVRVSFSKARCFYDFAEDGTAIYADGFYDPKANEIVVNPEGKRSAAKLLMHELSHALYKNRPFLGIF